MENNKPVNEVPSIPESELKLPEEQYRETVVAPVEPKNGKTIILLVLVVILLAAMGAAIFFGEELVNLFLSPEVVEMPAPMPETPPTETEPVGIESIETELEDMNFEEMETELEAIEAEIETETSATTTATTTP